MYARISRPWSFGSVRNSAPFADHSLYAVWMSATRTLRKALVRLGSGGVVRVTVGLSSVGSPPALRINHVFATFMITGSHSIKTLPSHSDIKNSRERSWSETTKKGVMTKPSFGAGKSSGSISSPPSYLDVTHLRRASVLLSSPGEAHTRPTINTAGEMS